MNETQPPARIEVPTDWEAYARERAERLPEAAATDIDESLDTIGPIVEEAPYDQQAAVETARRELTFIGGEDIEDMKVLIPAPKQRLIEETTASAPERPPTQPDKLEERVNFTVIQGVQDTPPKKRHFWQR